MANVRRTTKRRKTGHAYLGPCLSRATPRSTHRAAEREPDAALRCTPVSVGGTWCTLRTPSGGPRDSPKSA
eukprot:7007340-Prymnesium_polylepis.1